MQVFELERPSGMVCDVCPEPTTPADVLCDTCGIACCPNHSFHLLMSGPWQRKAIHRICCDRCAKNLQELNAKNPEWEESVTVIPRSVHREIDRDDFTHLIELFNRPAHSD